MMLTVHSRKIALSACLVLGLGAGASAQIEPQPFMDSGASTGLPGFGFSAFGPPVPIEQGGSLFAADADDGDPFTPTISGVWLADGVNDLSPDLVSAYTFPFVDGFAPGLSGLPGVELSGLILADVAPNGDAVFAGTDDDGDELLFARLGGTLTPIVSPGDVVVDRPGLVFVGDQFFSGLIGPGGLVYFSAAVGPGPTSGPANRSGLFASDGQALRTVALEDEATPGIPGGVYQGVGLPRRDPARGVVLVTEVVAGGARQFAVFADDGNVMSLVKALDEPPFDTLVLSDRLRGSDAENGWVAFATGPRNQNETHGIHRISPSGVVQTLASESDDAPGSSGSFREFSVPRVDRHGGVVFAADLSGSPGSGLYRYRDDSQTPIAVEGGVSPDGELYQRVFSEGLGRGNYTTSAEGDVVFSDLDDGDPTGLYAWTPGSGISLVVRDETSIDVDPDPLIEQARPIAMRSDILTDVPLYIPTIGADRRLGFRLYFENPFALLGYVTALPSLPCTADTNGDGMLSPADYNAWIMAFNDRSPACDQNNDGLCTPADFNAFLLNFNTGC